MCHRFRWPRSSFLSQERPWPQTFCKIRPILAKNLYFSAYFPLFLLFSWRRILANRLCFRSIFLNEMRKKERFGREISLPKVASSSLKMQRKCRKEKDKNFCLDETKRKMARDEKSKKASNTNGFSNSFISSDKLLIRFRFHAVILCCKWFVSKE